MSGFLRLTITGNIRGHDEKAVDDAVKRGLVVFIRTKRAIAPPAIQWEKSMLYLPITTFTIWVGFDMGHVTDVGLYAVTHNEADKGKFKTPSLRNIAQTAPYMSDGSLKDLKQAIDFYMGAGNSNPNLDKQIHVLDFLTGPERSDLQAFLNSLTGEISPDVGPPEVAKSKASKK